MDAIGPYEIEEEIGRGGVAIVYRARDKNLDRHVAIKLLREEATGQWRIRFNREAQALAKLHHPHIVTVHEIGEHQDRPYLVMELVEGRRIDLQGDSDAVVETLRKVALALEEAHRNGIIHRDLKPGNILVDPKGEPKVVDFGLAHLVDPELKLTKTGLSIGTPLYMAPEQVSGKVEKIAPSTDVYALGAMLYEMLMGKPPHIGTSSTVVFQKILREDPVAPRGPEDLVTICMKALEKDPARRYATAAEFAADLKRYRDRISIIAKRPTLIARVGKVVDRNRGVVATAAVTTILVGLVVGWLVMGILEKRDYRDAHERAKRAFAAERWEESLAECERALRIREGGDVAELALRCRAMIDHQKRARDLERSRAENFRVLQEKMRPVERLIRESRAFFYIEDIDLRAKIAKVETALKDLLALGEEKRYAEFSELWTLIGIGRDLMGDHPGAVEALRAADALGSTDPWTHLLLGKTYVQWALETYVSELGWTEEERVDRAAKLTKEAVGHLARRFEGVEEIDAHMARMWLALAEARDSDALEIAEEGLNRFGSDVGVEEFWNVIGWLSRGEEVIESYGNAIKRKPHYAWAYWMRGSVYADTNQFAEAKKDFTACLAINPRFTSAYFSRGFSRNLLRDAKGAEEDYTRFLEAHPENRFALFNRARANWRLRRLEEAVDDLNEAIRIHPGFTNAYVQRGHIVAEMGNLDEAIADYTAALKGRPNFPEALGGRGEARFKKKDYDGAIKDWTEALKVAPEDWPLRRSTERLVALARQMKEESDR